MHTLAYLLPDYQNQRAEPCFEATRRYVDDDVESMTLSLSLHQTRNARSRADFWNKLSIACKEARETPHWLRLLAAADIVGEPRLAEILDEADQLIAILTTITRKIRQNSEVWISKLERASNE
jgi:hypothetical protein